MTDPRSEPFYGECETCQHYSFKVAPGDVQAIFKSIAGKCYGYWPEVRWVNSDETCDRYVYDITSTTDPRKLAEFES